MLPKNKTSSTNQDQINHLNVYLRLLHAAKNYRGLLFLGFLGTMLSSGADSALSWAIKPLVDKGIVAHEPTLLIWLPFIIVIAFALRGATMFISNYYIMRVGRTVVMDFRQQVFNHLLLLPTNYYEKETSGSILALIIYNTEQLATATTNALLSLLQEGLLFIGLTVVMFVIDWRLTLLFMLSAPFITWIIRYTTKRLRRLSNRVQKCVGDVTHIAEEAVEGFKVIRIFNGEKYEKDKFLKSTDHNRNQEMKVVMTDSLGTALVQIIASLPIALIIYAALHFHTSIGSFSAMVVAIIRLFTPIRRLTKINTDIQRGVAAAGSIFNLLDEPPEIDQGKTSISRARGQIVYRNVYFQYPRMDKAILNYVNLEIAPGTTAALVGRSGSGKSTLVSLLPRFYDVLEGSIMLDGIDIRDYKLKDLRKQFAMVSQNVTLFNDTIAKNIAYGVTEKISEGEILKVAEAAYLSDFIKQLPEGLNTIIGEHGLLLSGGQRQRLAIARAILKDAPILILDEATSSLDTESEYYIQEALRKLMRNRTTLVIAHRLSTVERADKIMVMDKGKIIECGDHKTLLAGNGLYAVLYHMQFQNKEESEDKD